MKVKLSDLVEAMDAQSDEVTAHLNKRTGAVVCLSEEESSWSEDEGNLLGPDGPDWMKDMAELAGEVLSSGDYLDLPSPFDIHEYQIMERFCQSRDDDGQAEALSRAIAGRGAFGRFKDEIHRLGIQDQWYRYKDQALRRIAIDWCEGNGIAYSAD